MAFVRLFATVAFVATTGYASAQSPKPADALRIENVLSASTLSFRNDGSMDRAVLVGGEDGADLYLYLAQTAPGGGPDALKLALAKKNFVWSGAMWGTLPSLSQNGKGSLIVKSENTGIGRNKWEQALTVAWRNNEFLVVGVTYHSFDGLDPKAGGSCDLNLVTGKGTRSGKPVTFAPKPMKVADWSDDSLPKECRF
jgi:hypothetical protein